MAERYQRQTLFQAVGADDGRAQTAQRLASELSQFSQRTGQFAQEVQAKRGAEAGAQTGLDGAPKLKNSFTAYGAAYNNAALRNYTITSYADIEQNLTRLEQDAAGDPQQFQTLAKGFQKELLKGTLPAARGQVAELFTRRFAEGMGKVTQEAITNQKATNRAVLQQGVDTLQDSISRKLSSGDPVLMAEADDEEMQLHLMLDGAVNTGDLKQSEAITLKAAASKSITKQLIVGGFERTLVNGGDPVGYIDKLMKQPAENLSDDEKQQMVGELFQRLNQHQALQTEAVQLDTAETKARFAAGEKYATSQLLSGTLTIGKVQQLLDRDYLDPDVARTMRTALLDSGGSKTDDARERFHVETNLLSFTEEQIRDNPALSWETKRTLIDKRRDEATGWKSTQQAREAADRIDRALGILPGIDSRLLSEEDRRARDQALTEWYDAVDGMPEDERQFRALETSGVIIQRVIKGNAAKEAQQLENRLRAYQSDKDPAKLKGAALQEYNDTVQRLQSNIEAAKGKAR